jgi:uncharacterized protein YfaS (alpha-2-macroglobulin family)
MVAAAELGSVRAVPAVSILPSVLLAGVWKSPSALELRPQEPLPAATPFRLTIGGGLLDADGQPLGEDSVHGFQTPPLQVTGVRQVALSRDWTITLRVSFNDAVPLAELDRAIQFSDETGASVPMVRQTHGDAAQSADFRSDARRRERIVVALDAGLRGVSGPLGLAAPGRHSVQVESGLGLQGATGSMAEVDDGSIHLAFGLRVEPEVARDFLRIEPEVRYALEAEGGGLRLRGAFRAGTAYRVLLRAGLPAEGGRFLPDEVVRTVRMPELDPSLDLLGEGRFLTEGGSQTLLVRTVNVDHLLVSAERIYLNNLVHHLHGSRHVGAEFLAEKRIAVEGGRNQPHFTRLELKDLPGASGRGPFRIRVRSQDWWIRAERTVTVTDLGIHFKHSEQGLLAWVVRLSDVSPAAGARVTVLSRENQELWSGTTDAQGLAQWDGRVDSSPIVPPEGTSAGKGEPFVVTAASGDDLSYVPIEEAGLSLVGIDVGGRPYLDGPYEAFVYAERGVIRPGEAIHLRAMVRDRGGELPPLDMPLVWRVLRPDRRPAATSPATLSRHGTAELRWSSAAFHPTGRYTVRLEMPDGKTALGEAAFRVEEFLPETVRVEVAADDRRFAAADEILVRVRAEHLFGGPARGLRAGARIDLRPEPFVHDAHPGVAFTSANGEYAGSTLEAEPAALDERGEAVFRFRIPQELRARSALAAAITASVFQVSGRAATARILRAVDPLPFYLGARQGEGHARIGEEWRVEAMAIAPDGKPHAVASLDARLLRVSWSHALKRDPGSGSHRWLSQRQETQVAAGRVPCTDGRGEFTFKPEVGGEYRLVLTAARGPAELAVETAITFFAEGGGAEAGASLEVPSRIALTPDRPVYRAGETARVRVQSPITGLALLATETDRVHTTRTFQLSQAETTLEVPVAADLLPHGYVTLSVVRPASAPGGQGVPLRAYGAAPLKRDPAERAARVEVELPAEVRPGAELPLGLTVRRPDGAPEDAEVAVALVDAGILSLTAFATPDPLEFFHAQRRLGTRAADVYSLIVPEPGDFLARAPSSPGGDKDGGDGDAGGYLNPIAANRVRSVSIWLGGLATGAEGRVTATIPAPDFDGELTVLAVAAGKTSFAGTARAVKVRRPVGIEPGLPRFLAPGDRFQAPVSIHNSTAAPVHAVVAVASRGVRLAGGAAREQAADVPPGASTVLWFPLEAEAAVGAAEVSFTLQALGETVEKRTELAVRPASPPVSRFETLAVEPGKSAVFPEAGEFLAGTVRKQLVLSTSILPELDGSLHYLLHYPYGCIEQTTSTLIPWITLRDYLKATRAEDYTDGEIAERVQAGVERLFSMQTGGGGLGYWPGDRQPSVFGSLHAALVLLEARAAGHALPEQPFARLLDYLDGVLANPNEDDPHRAAGLRAFALHVLARAGRARPGWIESLHERRDDLGDEGRAHLAVAAALARVPLPGPLLDAQGVARRDASGADFPRELAGSFYSRPRELCFVLGALQELGTPREKLLPVFTALCGRREGGRYRSTLEDGLFVFTLGKMAKLFPPAAGPVRVVVKAGGDPPRTVEVKDRLELSIPAAAGTVGLEVEDGGTVTAALEARGVPAGKTAAVDEGLAVRRRFLLPGGEPRPPGPFRQGEPFIIEIQLKTPRDLPNAVVVDALPAGFEIENPALETNEARSILATAAPAEPDAASFGCSRSEVRDDRLILFAHPGAGTSRHRYVARAVTAGTFALPPIAAECMYDSSIRSVHGGGQVEVERR